LFCFVCAAEELTFADAAVKAGVSASWFSKQIHSLEQRVSCRLFQRQPTGIKLTPAGSVFLGFARDALKRFAQVKSDLRDVEVV
jgi:DNA-binding transcriptional LysR family regulator